MGDSIGVRVRRVGLAGSLALVAAGFGGLGIPSGSARSFAVGVQVKPLVATEKWIRVSVAGSDSVDLFAVQGVDFAIARVRSVRSSGVPAPACTITGTPATLTCVGHIRGGASVFVNVATSGTGGSYLFGEASAGQTIDLTGVPPSSQGDPLVPIAARMARGMGTKTVIFSGQTTFKEVEILPTSAFRIGRVTSVTAGGKKRPVSSCKREGDGLDCKLTLATGAIGKVTFTAPRTNARTIYGLPGTNDSVEVLLHGDNGTGDRFVVETRESPALKYDLVAGAAGTTRTVNTLGGSFGSVVIRNAPTAKRASVPASVTLRLEGNSKIFDPAPDCIGNGTTVPALAPGEHFTVCREEVGRAVRSGHVDLVVTVTCAKKRESNCANNKARARFTVKR